MIRSALRSGRIATLSKKYYGRNGTLSQRPVMACFSNIPRAASVDPVPSSTIDQERGEGKVLVQQQQKKNGSERAWSVQSFKVMDVLQRANQIEAENKKVFHCEIGQPETGAPVAVKQGAIEALHEHVMGYTSAFGLTALREKIKQHYENHYKSLSSVPSIDRIVVTTGSSGGFLLAFTGCFDVGDVVAIASSGYPCYRNILSALGCQLAHVPINAQFKLTAAELEKEIRRRHVTKEKPLKGLILSSPSNPTGAMLTPHELQELCQLCDNNNIQFISDEIYHGISYGMEEATALQFSNTPIIINSFSKYYSMPGWRLGWMVIPESLIDPINRLQQNMFINAPTVAQRAAMHCWDPESIAELDQHLEKYRKSRQLILDELASIPEIDYSLIAPADGGFYVYVDLGQNNVVPGRYGSVELCQMLLEEEHSAMTPGIDFEDPSSGLGQRRFRISYAGGVENIREAMQRFHRLWPKWTQLVRQAKQEQ